MGGIWKPAGRPRYRIWYKDHEGVRRTEPGYADRQSTLAKLTRLMRNADRRSEGLPVTDEGGKLRELAGLEAIFLADLKRQGAGQDHYKLVSGNLRRLRQWEGWSVLRDVRHASFTEALNRLDAKGRSTRTLEAYRLHWLAFLDWCVDRGDLEANPIARIKRPRRTKLVRIKRAFLLAEWHALLGVARPHHADVYTIAGLTGLRWKECSLLECRDVDLDQGRLRLRAEMTKAKRADVCPLLPDVLPLLHRLCQGLAPRDRILPRMPARHTTVKYIRAAGLVTPDRDGRHLSFHSLRYFFCTLLARSLPIQVVSLLMRHKNISTTCRIYLDLGIDDVTESMLKLPPILLAPAGATDKESGERKV